MREENIKTLAEAVDKIMRTDRPELVEVHANSCVGYVLGRVGRICFLFSQN